MSALEVVIGIASVVAIMVSPLVALEVEKHLDDRRESYNRKLTIFKTLMMYRVTPLSPNFVQSLNLVDLEFNGNNEDEAAVRDKWKVLLDHFNNYNSVSNPREKAADLTMELLKAMSTCLGFGFDEVYLKRGGYYPELFDTIEKEQHAIRRGVFELLEGNRRLPIGIFEQKFPELTDQPRDKL